MMRGLPASEVSCIDAGHRVSPITQICLCYIMAMRVDKNKEDYLTSIEESTLSMLLSVFSSRPLLFSWTKEQVCSKNRLFAEVVTLWRRRIFLRIAVGRFGANQDLVLPLS